MTKKEQIMIAAEELFDEFGFEGTSVRALAKKADVNVAMISYYFGSKEQLFSELVNYRSSFLREKIHDLQKDPADPVTKIETLIDLYVDKIFTNYRFHRIIHRQISLPHRTELNEMIVNVLMKNVEEVKKIISDGVEKKVFRNADNDMIIITIMGCISQLTLLNLMSSKVLGYGHDDCYLKNDVVRNRAKAYLKDLIKKYLCIEQ